MEQLRYFLVLLTFLLTTEALTDGHGGYVIKNPIRFPYGGPYIGMFLAIAVPLDLPQYNVFVSYNIEANYNLPQNQTEFVYPPVISKRSLDRSNIFGLLQNKLDNYGYPGKNCLLRMICEAAKYSMDKTGVLGDIFHIILSPSTSNDQIDDEYMAAENYGKLKKHCRKYKKMCSANILDVISMIQ